MNEYFIIEIIGIILGLFLVILVPSFRKIFFIDSSEQEKTKVQERNEVFDFVRGFAIIGIVIIHTDSYFSYFHPHNSEIKITRLLANYFRISVPVFIFSSALFLKYKSSSSYWKPRINKLFIPYFIVAVIGYFIRFYPFQNFEISHFILQIFLGRVYEPFYFIPIIFEFYLIYYFFHEWFGKMGKKISLLFVFSFMLINIFSNQYFALPHSKEVIRWKMVLFTNYAFFFAIGLVGKERFISKIEFMKLFESNKSLIFLVLSVVVYNIFIFYYTITDLFQCSSRFIFYPFAMCIILIYLGLYLEKRQNKFAISFYKLFVYLGKNSLSIFLLHPVIIHLMHSIDPYKMYGPFFAWIITFSINTFLPIIIRNITEQAKLLFMLGTNKIMKND